MPYGISRYMLFLTLVLGYSGYGSAQDRNCGAIRMVGVEFDENSGLLEFQLVARNNDCTITEGLIPTDLGIFEAIEFGTTEQIDIVDIEFSPRYDTVDLSSDTVQVLFMVERSTSIGDADTDRQNELVNNFLAEYADQLGPNTNYYVSTIGQNPGEFTGGTRQQFTRGLNKINNSETSQGRPDLYLSLISALNKLEQLPGQKFVFLLTSGDHQTNQERYAEGGPRIPPDINQVEIMIDNFGNNLYFFPILIGSGVGEDNEVVLEIMVDASRDLGDVLAYDALPDRELREAINNNTKLIYTHRVKASTRNRTFKGERREYCMLESSRPNADPTANCRRFRTGSFANPKTIRLERSGLPYLIYTGGGAFGVLFLLGIFALLYPLIRQWKFRSKHVVAYEGRPGRTINDPITREPINDGDLVVNICRMPVPLETWRECNYQCPHYPNCTKSNLQCKGEGARENQAFFRATGTNRLLNWIWFGALGGLVGWLIFATMDWFMLDGTGSLGLYADNIIRQYTEGASADSLVKDMLVGVSFGTGLILLLSIMEERTQSRKFSYRRIVMRTVIGAMVSLVIFSGGFLLQATGLIPYPLLAAAVTWLLFGVGVGVVLLVNSSISNLRGIVGGMLASLLGFVVYWSISYLAEDFYLAKVASLILSGAVLGGVLDTVIHLAEDYEMEYITPVEYSHNTVPLSKWLKSGWEIIIGTQQGCQVYIKWPDPVVEPEHAKISLEGGRVYLFPFAETLVNGKITTGQKKIQLHDGDIIRLGRDAKTEMRFKEKQKAISE